MKYNTQTIDIFFGGDGGVLKGVGDLELENVNWEYRIRFHEYMQPSLLKFNPLKVTAIDI